MTRPTPSRSISTLASTWPAAKRRERVSDIHGVLERLVVASVQEDSDSSSEGEGEGKGKGKSFDRDGINQSKSDPNLWSVDWRKTGSRMRERQRRTKSMGMAPRPNSDP